MAKSILTPEGDLVNYDNLIAVSVEVRPVGVDEEHSEDEYCIVGTDVTNKENLLYHSPDYDKVMSVQRDITRWSRPLLEPHRARAFRYSSPKKERVKQSSRSTNSRVYRWGRM